jgi:hypothetical protein
LLNKILYLAFFCFLANVSFTAKAQTAFKVQGGFSYLEHLSLGGTFELNERQSISILYGSNFFIKPKDFSSFLLQYALDFPEKKIGNFTPLTGLKSGYAIYTNENYKWQVITVVPFIGVSYPLNEKLNIRVESGAAISFE